MAIVEGRCGAALWITAIAALTDAADGFIARRFGWESRLGALLDPAADKLMMTSMYAALAIAEFAPWPLVGIVFARDLWIVAMVSYGAMRAKRREFPPSAMGKASTAVQMMGLAGFLALCGGGGWQTPALTWTVAAVTLWSGADYTARAWRRWRERGRARSPGEGTRR